MKYILLFIVVFAQSFLYAQYRHYDGEISKDFFYYHGAADNTDCFCYGLLAYGHDLGDPLQSSYGEQYSLSSRFSKYYPRYEAYILDSNVVTYIRTMEETVRKEYGLLRSTVELNYYKGVLKRILIDLRSTPIKGHEKYYDDMKSVLESSYYKSDGTIEYVTDTQLEVNGVFWVHKIGNYEIAIRLYGISRDGKGSRILIEYAATDF